MTQDSPSAAGDTSSSAPLPSASGRARRQARAARGLRRPRAHGLRRGAHTYRLSPLSRAKIISATTPRAHACCAAIAQGDRRASSSTASASSPCAGLHSGFLAFHATGGGTGSGLGSLISRACRATDARSRSTTAASPRSNAALCGDLNSSCARLHGRQHDGHRRRRARRTRTAHRPQVHRFDGVRQATSPSSSCLPASARAWRRASCRDLLRAGRRGPRLASK